MTRRATYHVLLLATQDLGLGDLDRGWGKLRSIFVKSGTIEPESARVALSRPAGVSQDSGSERRGARPGASWARWARVRGAQR
jgi:hypothetical protein